MDLKDINITMIIDGIAKKFANMFPNITVYMNEVEQNMAVPAVFIKVNNFTETKVNGKYRYRDNIDFLIKYIPEDTDNATYECFNVLEDCSDIVERIELETKDVLIGQGIESNVTDGILNIYVTYNFFVYKNIEQSALMGDLIVESNAKE